MANGTRLQSIHDGIGKAVLVPSVRAIWVCHGRTMLVSALTQLSTIAGKIEAHDTFMKNEVRKFFAECVYW